MKSLTNTTKSLYGLGFAAQGIKDGLFQLFLFFYFSQVLGLDPQLAGLSSLIALVFDAISDPMVGVLSDKWKSEKWGRRHPFVFASAIPIGLFTWLLFSPPEGLTETQLFWWLTGFAILVRTALTLFAVPYTSLGAELSTDYKERTSITASRLMFAAFLSPVVMTVGYSLYFVPTSTHSNGLLNEAAYSEFALLCGGLMTFFVLISAWGTRHVIPELPKISETQRQASLGQLLGNLRIALSMKSFSSLVIYTMLTFVGLGIGIIFSPYYGPYYFGFTSQEMAVLPIGSALGSIFSLLIAPNLGDRLDKKWATLMTAGLAGIFFTLPYNLRILGFFPENGSSLLLPFFALTLIFAYTALWISMSIGASMMADVIDEFELITDNRQEGLFFSFTSLAGKMTTGVGTFLAGLLLSWIEFPTQTAVGDVPAEAVERLGWIGGPFGLVFYVVSLGFLLAYPISKERYQEIRTALDARRE